MLSLLCRATRPISLANPEATGRCNMASLSGIHQGLRRSQRVDPRGSKTADASKLLTYRERKEAREKLKNPGFKIMKGKKDITKYAEELRPQSRRARFYDPNSGFGKKSLVYQVKSGQLREELRNMKDDGGDLFNQNIIPFGDEKPERRNRSRPRDAGRGFRDRRDRPERRPPSLAAGSLRPLRDSRRDSEGGWSGSGRSDLTTTRDSGRRATPETWESSRANSTPVKPEDTESKPRRDHHPISIPYTTAVSQFLYGKSVVEAALRGGRRKLYKLYMYRGQDAEAQKRRNKGERATAASEAAAIERLAGVKGVKTVVLSREDGLRLMDKMSGNRPHNNLVLEASPLPQLPVTGLGPLSSDPSKPGFLLHLAHQSAEEVAITGTSDFITIPKPLDSTPLSHKPLVVLLHGVLDPGNLGAILRSASFLGASAVATTKRGSASLTPVALKAAAGASETVTLLSVDSVDRFLEESRHAGWAIYAAAPPPANGRYTRPHVDMRTVEETDPLREKPIVLMLGSEGEGLPKSVRRLADFDVHIPNLLGSNMVDSLNVSVAAGLLCHAFLSGRSGEKAASEKEKDGGELF